MGALAIGAMILAGNMRAADAAAGRTYWVQLVRGTDDKNPPTAGCKPIGPKVAKVFLPVFKWSHYWEMSRQETVVEVGSKAVVQLSPQRSVEIDLTDPKKRKVTAFEGTKPVYKVTDPVGNAMTIIGGERSTNSSWFIVVRRDKPIG